MSEARYLLMTVDSFRCALPLEHVSETMRPLAVEPAPAAPPFVLGLAVVRGAAIPVVDLARLLGGASTPASRFVVLQVEERRVALAVDTVLGVRSLPEETLLDLPPLFGDSSAETIRALAALDGELYLVLGSLRRISDSLGASSEAIGGAT